jgi:hypothetical protein
MKRLALALAWISFMATGCREIWYYQPMGASRDVRDGKGYWIDLGEVQLGSWCPFVVAPWKRGDEAVMVGFKLQNKTDAELRVQDAHVRVGKLRLQSSLPVDDKVNGLAIPARGESEFLLWISFPDQVADMPREFVLTFDLVTPDGVRRKEVTYSY